MSPNPLEGLNIVYPPPSSRTASSQELLAAPGFPDFSAQLDLWTNLNFASDEPFINSRRKDEELIDLDFRGGSLLSREMGGEMATGLSPLIADHDKQLATKDQPALIPSGSSGSFDLGNFLAGFGIDPFLVPPRPASESDFPIQTIAASSTAGSPPAPPSTYAASEPDVQQPPTKRNRTSRKASATTPSDSSAADKPPSEFSLDHDPLTTPLTASEDKRRRNTAASARFRAKKKEREQAMEKRGKELEQRVSELERECEGLRRENGWLKGLVVGVTSGNPATIPPSGVSLPEIKAEQVKQDSGKKRKRESTNATGG